MANAEGHGGGDAKTASGLRCLRARFPIRFLDLIEDSAGMAGIGLAHLGQADPPCRPIEKRRAELSFQIHDQARGCGARQAEVIGRGGEAATLDHRREQAERARSLSIY